MTEATGSGSPALYRQRLTGLGWAGVAAALGGPVVLGFVLGDYVESLGNRYHVPRPPVIEAMVLSLISLSGWIMILVGREHYPYAPPLESPRASDAGRDDDAFLSGN